MSIHERTKAKSLTARIASAKRRGRMQYRGWKIAINRRGQWRAIAKSGDKAAGFERIENVLKLIDSLEEGGKESALMNEAG